MRRSDVEQWVDRYRVAWESNDPAAIGALFADDAAYRTGPFEQAWQGRDEIVEGWLGRRDEPGETTFSSEVLAVDGDLGVVRGDTTYRSGEVYANLWLVRLDAEGRCTDFTEWWVEPRSS